VLELLGVVELERGRYGGRPVDRAKIDDLAARGEQSLLRRFADRLPTQELRDQARRWLLRMAIAASPFEEVRAQARTVEERVMREGVNRIPLAQLPAVHATLETNKLPVVRVLVRQDVLRQTTALFAVGDSGALSVVPALSFVGVLWVEVEGLSRPVTICGSPRAFDPTPCIDPGEVTIDNPFAIAGRDGTFHVRDRAGEAETMAATKLKRWLALPIEVGGRRLASFGWPVRFERPADLVFSPAAGRGPDLKVMISRLDSALLAFTVSDGELTYRAIVDDSDLPGFHVISRGAPGGPGRSGFDGSDGSSGLDGSDASCPATSGSDGSRGGDGGDGDDGGAGSDGGDGGDIQVDLHCGAQACGPVMVDLLRRAMVSRGGAGGAGGAGGRGGRGGRGGMGGRGTTCIDPATGESRSFSGGSDGTNGRDGSPGAAGRAGASGRPGQVRLRALAGSDA